MRVNFDGPGSGGHGRFCGGFFRGRDLFRPGNLGHGSLDFRRLGGQVLQTAVVGRLYASV
jgi:hypothetical protein